MSKTPKMELIEEVDFDTEFDAIKYAEEERDNLSGIGYRVTQKGKRVRVFKRRRLPIEN